jgi:hypothetical protein
MNKLLVTKAPNFNPAGANFKNNNKLQSYPAVFVEGEREWGEHYLCATEVSFVSSISFQHDR